MQLSPPPPLAADYEITDSQVAQFRRDGFIVLRGVLDAEEIAAYEQAIRDTAMVFFRRYHMEPAPHGGFLQRKLNLRYESEGVRRFCLAPRFGRIAARLLQVPAVRIYHDQPLFKQPGGAESAWHQDQFYWPLATDRALGLWMPLVDCTEQMGSMRFVVGSHRFGDLGGGVISAGAAGFFDRFIAREQLSIFQTDSLAAGDCTFHSGWTIHGAPANHSATMREAMIVTFYPDGTRVAEFDNPQRAGNAKAFLGGREPGQPADSALNPVVYREQEPTAR